MAEENAVPVRRFTILIDTREKPTNALFDEGSALKEHDPILAYKRQKLDTGDYAIQEAPELVCIEKKQNGKELHSNFVHQRDRFMRELDRMKPFKHKWIVIQQTYEEFCDPRNWVGVQKPETAMAIVEGWLMRLTSEQDVYFIFAGKNADRWVRRLMTKVYDVERKRLRNASKS